MAGNARHQADEALWYGVLFFVFSVFVMFFYRDKRLFVVKNYYFSCFFCCYVWFPCSRFAWCR